MTLRERQRILTFAALGCVGLLLAERLAITPLVHAVKDWESQTRKLSVELRETHSLLEQAGAWSQRLAQYRLRALPAGRSATENQVIKILRQWYTDSGLQVNSMKTRWRPEDKKYPCLEVHLNAGGDLRAVTRFLYDAETSASPVRITSVSLTPSGTDPRNITLTVELEAVSWTGSNATGTTGDES